MTTSEYINNIKLQLLGSGVLESELTDEALGNIVTMSVRELQRYYDSTRFVSAVAEPCIDLSAVETSGNIKISSIANIFRDKPSGGTADAGGLTDPALLTMWNSGSGYGYGTQRWVYNYLTYSTLQQLSNTMSTDLQFEEDTYGRKLYINYSQNKPDTITIEYIPKIEAAEDVVGPYWVDILARLSVAHAKEIYGNIRTRFTQSSGLWTQDGEKMRNEGIEELKALRERLASQANFSYPLD